jgi:hypothetical protein
VAQGFSPASILRFAPEFERAARVQAIGDGAGCDGDIVEQVQVGGQHLTDHQQIAFRLNLEANPEAALLVDGSGLVGIDRSLVTAQVADRWPRW